MTRRTIQAADVSLTFTAWSPCVETYTPIYQIQGPGATAAITGTVTTQGVVVGDYEGPSPALRGFYLQDAAGDGDPATSDGIFVFNGSNADSVNLGDVVRVTGRAGENQGQTQVSVSSSNILKCGTGTVAPVDVTLPFPSLTLPEAIRGHAGALPPAALCHRALPTRPLRPGRALVRVGVWCSRPTLRRPARLRRRSRQPTTSTASFSTMPRRARTPTRSSLAAAASRSRCQPTRCAAATAPPASSA